MGNYRYKYTIIIPVYNAERTICRCIDSLICQDYTDAEIILIDDGSSDSSLTICQEYANRFPWIKCIAKTNGGVSSARNLGIDNASGEYLLFVDSDDYVSECYFKTLDGLTAERNCDFILFSHYQTNGKICTERIRAPFSSSDMDVVMAKFSEMLYTKVINPPWNKCYNAAIIRNARLRFNEKLSIGEDKLFCLQYALMCHNCNVSTQPIYYVSTENENSLSRKIRKDSKMQSRILEYALHDTILCADIGDRQRHYFFEAENYLQCSHIYSEAKQMHKAGMKISRRLKEIGRLCDEFNQKKLQLPDSRYCKLLHLPVKFRLTILLDMVGWKLAR